MNNPKSLITKKKSRTGERRKPNQPQRNGAMIIQESSVNSETPTPIEPNVMDELTETSSEGAVKPTVPNLTDELIETSNQDAAKTKVPNVTDKLTETGNQDAAKSTVPNVTDELTETGSEDTAKTTGNKPKVSKTKTQESTTIRISKNTRKTINVILKLKKANTMDQYISRLIEADLKNLSKSELKMYETLLKLEK